MQLSWTKSKKNVLIMGLFIATISLFTACSKDEDNAGPDHNSPDPVEISSDITTDTVLADRGDGVDYIFCGGITVEAALKIEPGVTIQMCPDANVWVEDEGSFYAVGTKDKPITIEGKEHAKGYWGNIDFRTNDPDNQIAYAAILDGGGNGSSDAVVYLTSINKAQLSLTHTTIGNSKAIGLYVDWGGATLSDFSDNHFKDNGTYPVKISLEQMGALDEATDYGDNNGKNFIYVRKVGPINKDATVAATNVPYFINEFVKVKAGLTLQPGTQFVMGSDATLIIEKEGFLNAEGSVEDSISIRGKVDAVGYWNYISIESNNAQNVMKYVTIANGGEGKSGYSDHASLGVYGFNHGQLTLQHCTIDDSYGWGLYVDDGASITPQDITTLENANTFSNNGTGSEADCDGDCNVHIE